MTYSSRRPFNDMEDQSFMKPRCYTTHKPLVLGEGMIVYGGSCSYPVVLDADIYVGLDYGMKSSPMAFPWEKGESFLFSIPDMKAPANPDQFKKMIEWLAVQLTAQKRVHVGCIGGHGRTGTVLSALVAEVMGNKDAINYVRANYCVKAVESREQVDFLAKHFGITPTAGAKEYVRPVMPVSRPITKAKLSTGMPTRAEQKAPSIAIPVRSSHGVWGDNFIIDK